MKRVVPVMLISFSFFLIACAKKNAEFEVKILEDDTCEIVSLKDSGQDKEIVIPNDIDGKKVSSIGELVFSNQNKLKSITLPEGLIKICDSAFTNCTSLESITMPNSLESIGYGVFESCVSLSSVNLNEGLNEIDANAFANCTALTQIDLPDSLASMGSQVFAGCHNLIDLDALKPTVNYVDNWIVYAHDLSGEIIIEDGTVGIADNAFFDERITSIKLPNSLKYIGFEAFRENIDLESIHFEKNIKTIGGKAFYGCEKLNKVYIADETPWYSVNIGEDGTPFKFAEEVYYGDQLFEEVSIPEGTEEIGDNAFNSLYTLKEIDIPSSLNKIGINAFMNVPQLSKVSVDSLESWCNIQFENEYSNPLDNSLLYIGNEVAYSVEIPASINELKPYVFSKYDGLTTIKLNDKITKISDYAFYGCKNLISININNVKEIGDYSFYGTAFTGIGISDSVERIGDYAFAYCNNVERVIIGSNVNYIGSYAFYGLEKISSIAFNDEEGWSVLSNDENAIKVDVKENGFYLVLTPHIHNKENPYDGYIWIKNN